MLKRKPFAKRLNGHAGNLLGRKWCFFKLRKIHALSPVIKVVTEEIQDHIYCHESRLSSVALAMTTLKGERKLGGFLF